MVPKRRRPWGPGTIPLAPTSSGRTLDECPPEIEDQRLAPPAHDHLHPGFDEHDRHPLFLDPPHHRQGLLHLDAVETGHYFIEQQQSWTHGERAGNLQTFAVRDG